MILDRFDFLAHVYVLGLEGLQLSSKKIGCYALVHSAMIADSVLPVQSIFVLVHVNNKC